MNTGAKVEEIVSQHFATGETVAALIRRGEQTDWPHEKCTSRLYQVDPQPSLPELEWIELLAAGKTSAELAAKYGCSLHAMRTAIYRLRKLMGADTNAGLVAIALRRGWIQ